MTEIARKKRLDQADTTARKKGLATLASSEPMKAASFSAGWRLRRLHGLPLAPRELCLSLELSSTRLTDGNFTVIQCLLVPFAGSVARYGENNTLKGTKVLSKNFVQ